MTLLKYPLPELDHTIEEIKRVLKLVLNREEFEKFSNNLREKKGKLKKYDEAFKKEIENKDNWATEIFRHQLLSLRYPIPVSTALPIIMKSSTLHTDQFSHSAALLWSVGKIMLNTNEFIKQLQGNDLEDTQQSEIFSTVRIPLRDTDNIKVYKGSRHAVLLYKGSAFQIDILTDDGELVSIQDIYDQIISISLYDGPFYQEICNYTAYDRNVWSDIRTRLLEGDSQKSLDIMERAIVTVAVEEIDMPDGMQNAMDYIRLGGDEEISCMRYYDKILNVIVFKNGKYGLLFEHSAVDGLIVAMMAKLLHTICETLIIDRTVFKQRTVNIIDFKIRENISKVPLQYNHSMSTFEYRSYPDIFKILREERIYFPWINYSLQLAILKTFGNLKYLMVTPTHVRHFKHGRSDPTYSITINSNKLLNYMLNNEDNTNVLIQFVAALEEHRKMVKFTKNGKGIGPHIAQIRKMLKEDGNGLTSCLEKFAKPHIYLTGSELLEEVECGVGNVYASDQIVVGYVGKRDRIIIIMSATGIFVEKLNTLKENFQKSLHLMLNIASRAAIASQMNALYLFRSNNPFDIIPKKKFSIAVHGGAGEELLLQQDVIEVIKFSLRIAVVVGVSMLNNGKSSVDAVEAAVAALENCFLFNAGRGAVYNYDGAHELEASIIDGKSQNSGSVACITDIKNPIKAARLIMEKSSHALISGTLDKSICIDNNICQVKNNYFDTDIRYKQLMMIKSKLQSFSVNHPQTVGAVAKDADGNLAAASSTGGIVNKLKGRIGDTAIVGAGVYADQNIALACTGDGETFLRKSIANKIAMLCKYMNFSLQDASQVVIQDELQSSYGGVIGVDSKGNVSVESNAKVMFAASYNGDKFDVKVRSKNTDAHEWIIFENDRIVAYLHSSPCTTGVTILRAKSEFVYDIFALPIHEFVKIMLDIQHVSNLLCDRLGVQRCALIAEPQDGQSTKILLIPLHGLSDAWKPCICSEPEFNSCYPGYCTSKNGPRASDDELNKIQNKIRNKLDSQELNFKFYGDANDDNLFAKIVRGDEKAQWRVWEDEDHVAFLTPFPNTPGFTVLVPRKHLDSNIFALDKPDFEKLMVATHKVSNLLMKALEIKSCAMIFEGCEIDYAHVKLIPLLNGEKETEKSKTKEFEVNYSGHVSSQDGPKAHNDDLNVVYKKIISIVAPASWKNPEQHSITAITHPWYSAIFKLQNTLYHSTVSFFHQYNNYYYALTPMTTDTISSPMGLGSDSDPVNINLMNQNVYLADSMQFCLEYFLRLQDNLPGTYYISPSFRGENPDNSHLNQFYHIECELCGSMDDAICIAEQYIYYITKNMFNKNKEIILKLSGSIAHIEDMLKRYEIKKCFPRITLDEALKELPSTDCFEFVEETRPELGRKLTRKGEQVLINKYHGIVWLTEMDHLSVPFYQAYVEGTNFRKAKAADLLIGIGESLGLGERHETAKEVKDALTHHQVSEESYRWYINMRQVKPLKTSGWGLGSERYLCWLLNHHDVRDMQIIPRLKNQKFLP
ncbi:uncharacterized protein LOC111640366 [Centruroides sculpturatus]|uniref:uncharacterized protein LOC111640366 n=1 Tax=Centruroides sculpturatus TaxID=218467 RepID=UPI000C6E53E5|nr:uncharacterized protein LOC111640366 [Centruroides sculpturatus]XP_023242151.1 uncharacterized protein LOC111640366 [Centruroides sculpturatus]